MGPALPDRAGPTARIAGEGAGVPRARDRGPGPLGGTGGTTNGAPARAALRPVRVCGVARSAPPPVDVSPAGRHCGAPVWLRRNRQRAGGAALVRPAPDRAGQPSRGHWVLGRRAARGAVAGVWRAGGRRSEMSGVRAPVAGRAAAVPGRGRARGAREAARWPAVTVHRRRISHPERTGRRYQDRLPAVVPPPRVPRQHVAARPGPLSGWGEERPRRMGARAGRAGQERRRAPRGPVYGRRVRWSAEHGSDRPPRHLLGTSKGRARVVTRSRPL